MLDIVDGNPIVTTGAGQLRGHLDSRVSQFRFLGIPYAEPPLGPLRFRPPCAKAPWSGLLDCSRFGPAGPQLFDPTEGAYEEFTDEPAGDTPRHWVGSEDCLTLNIWRRADGTAKKPVLVWIHGGANWLESSRLDTYHGDSFVARQDVIFVSLNYRLGVFGFLDLSCIGGPEYQGSDNNGLRDQILALRWIRDNIAAFGGDSDNITVMGESAGSIDISWHLAAGQLQGIARRVVMMSGVAGLPGLTAKLPEEWSEAHGIALARRFLDQLGIAGIDDLQSRSTQSIMENVVRVAASSDMLFELDSLFWPHVSATYAAADPFAAAKDGRIDGIDVMIGCTDYEMGLWLNWDDTLDQHPCRRIVDRLPLLTAAQRDDAVRQYGTWFADDTPGSHGLHLLGDILFRLPTIWFAEELVRHGVKVWMYLFDWAVDDRRRALHAADQCFLFKKWDTAAGQQLVGRAADAQELAQRTDLGTVMQDAVLAFATTGNPNETGLPAWPTYDIAARNVMRFGRQVVLAQDPVGERRKWWTETIYQSLR